MWKKYYRIGKEKNIPAKDKWEIPAVIPLMPIVGLNHRLPILHMNKIMLHIYTSCKIMNQFTIGYMIKPSLRFNNAFRTQVEKCLDYSFYIRTMKTIKNVLMDNNTSVMSLIMINEKMEKYKKIYSVLSCVVYTLIENYVCIDYMSCQ